MRLPIDRARQVTVNEAAIRAELGELAAWLRLDGVEVERVARL